MTLLYNYHVLEKLLIEDSSPLELGHQIDDIMHLLVLQSAGDELYHSKLAEHYHILRKLRDILWTLEKTNTDTPLLKLQR